MNRSYLIVLCLIQCFAAGCSQLEAVEETATGQKPQNYLVVSLVPPADDFNRAGKILVQRHGGQQILADPDNIIDLLPQLQKRQPDFVAFVVRPEHLDINLVQQILKLSTRVDSDPFVDFSYGFITGRDADAAVKLVKASQAESRNDPGIAQFGVASNQLPRSMEQKTAWPLRKGSVSVTAFMSRGASDEERDDKFIAESMPKLEVAPILLFASHGYPNGLVGGPKAADLKGRDFSGSVALNIACYNGVTSTWFEDDWKTGQVRKRNVDAKESFCLQIIDSGVAAYIAYVSPRPAGPTMMGDAMLVASAGQSVGELQRENANSVVLAHLLSGSDTVEIKEFTDGDVLPADRTPGEIVRAMSTGGLLIGDPAFTPFRKKKDANPVSQTVDSKNDRILVDLHIGTPIFHFFASEPINYWDDRSPAMRLETTVPIDDLKILDVRLVESSFGDAPYRLVAAVEMHEGKRFVRLKAVFERPATGKLQRLVASGIKGRFEVLTTAGDVDTDTSKKIIRREFNGQ